jgi:hypothetical protein
MAMAKAINSDYSPAATAQRSKRIRLAVYAYAYEIESDPIVDDATFDALSEEIDLSITTGNPKMDKWYKKEFDSCTGQWIHSHPELAGIKRIYNTVRKKK